MAAEVDGNDADADVLVEVYDAGGVGDVFIGQLGDVDESVLMETSLLIVALHIDATEVR